MRFEATSGHAVLKPWQRARTSPGRRAGRQRGHIWLIGGLAAALVMSAMPASADDPDLAAHALAERFAGESDAARQKRLEKRAKEARQLQEIAEAAERDARANQAAAKRKADEASELLEAARRAAAQLRADEADMLRRARAEFESRRAEDAKAAADLARAEDEQRVATDKAEDARRVAEAARRATQEARPEPSQSQDPESERETAATGRKASEAEFRDAFARHADREEERLRREKAQAARRATQEEQAEGADQASSGTGQAQNSDHSEALIAEARRADAERRQAAERDRETELLAEKLRQARERLAARRSRPEEPGAVMPSSEPAEDSIESTREAQRDREDLNWQERAAARARQEERERLAPPDTATLGSRAADEASEPRTRTRTAVPVPVEIPLPPAQPLEAADDRVTILLVMEAGTRGIRRHDKTADPVLCFADRCYISKGPARDAARKSRWKTLGTFNTLGRRAGACNDSLACVFRNIDLGAGSRRLQPIDLRLIRHDRREARDVSADGSCSLEFGEIVCANPIATESYRLWIVPEALARKAGAGALAQAIREGLPRGRRGAFLGTR